MGKLRVWLVLPVLAILCGCGKTAESHMGEALDFRAKLQGAGGCSFHTEITADYGDTVYTFSVACTTEEDGDLTFTVESPETIAGITGTVESEGGKLTFDDTALAFELLADGKVSPVTAPYVVTESWRTGYITAAGREERGLRMTVDSSFEEKPLTVETWLDGEKGVPIFSEVCYNGQRILTLTIWNFQYNMDTE